MNRTDARERLRNRRLEVRILWGVLLFSLSFERFSSLSIAQTAVWDVSDSGSQVSTVTIDNQRWSRKPLANPLTSLTETRTMSQLLPRSRQA